MKSRKELILEYMYKNSYGEEKQQIFFTTDILSEKLGLQRTYVSTILNELVKDGTIEKRQGRPVKYYLNSLSDTQHSEKAVFSNLAGYDNTLMYTIQEIKAALAYPQEHKRILIQGELGVGKTGFAQAAFLYAKENLLISSHAQMEVLDGVYIKERIEKKETIREYVASLPHQEQVEYLIIDHMEQLGIQEQSEIWKEMDQVFPYVRVFVAVYTKEDQKETIGSMQKGYDFVISVPPLHQYQVKERFEILCASFNKQALLLKRKIKIDSILLKCLLSYTVPGNIHQLREDIKKGCANGYSRVYRNTGEREILFLFIKDFPQHVRKGLLDYAKQSDEINELIKDQACVFDGYQYQLEEINSDGKNVKVSLTQTFENITTKLMNMGASKDEIATLISVDAVTWLQRYQDQIAGFIQDEVQLKRYVDPQIMGLVDDLMEKAQKNLQRIYSEAAYHSFCVFVTDILKEKQLMNPMLYKMVENVPRQCKAEYELAKEFVHQLEQIFGKIIGEQDIILLALMLISVESLTTRTQRKPIVLFVIHGKGTATSLAKCIRELTQNFNIFGFDLDLDHDLDRAYHDLKELVLKLDNGKGLLLIYDMGSIEHMGTMLKKEIDVDIKMIKLPSTLFLLEASKKAEVIKDLDTLYEEVLTCANETFTMLEGSYYRSKERYTIIVLSHSGRSEVIQMKKYLENQVDLHGVTDVIPIATSDKDYLLKEINRLRKTSTILCVIGAYDPKLYHIPYISFAKVLSIPRDRLMFLLYYEDIDIDEIPDYREKTFVYINTNLPELQDGDFESGIKYCLSVISKAGYTMTKETEIDFVLDVAFSISKELQGTKASFHKAKKQVIIHHKTLYHYLKDGLSYLENEYNCQMSDSHIADLISMIIKKIDKK